MKQEFTSFDNNQRLIIIFAGWGMSADPFRHLRVEDCDIMTVWDYTTVDFDPSPLAGYEDIYIRLVIRCIHGPACHKTARHKAHFKYSGKRLTSPY